MTSCENPSTTSYQRGCRCDACRKAARDYHRDYDARKRTGGPTKWELNRQARKAAVKTSCGNPSPGSYRNGCRCDACRFARSEYQHQLRRRHQLLAEARIRAAIERTCA